MDNNEKFYEKQWFMWTTLIFLAPVGIFLMWKYNRFAKGPRIAISAVSAIIFLAIVVPGQTANSNVATQSRSQTKVSNQVTTDEQVAANLNAKIVALGVTTSLTLEKADEVKAIRTEYDGLTNDQQRYVTNLVVLTDAEKIISDLQIAEDKAAADKAAADKATADKAASDKAAAEIAASQSTSSSSGNTSSNSGSSSSVSGGTTTYEPAQGQRTVYWVPNGKSYHYNRNCSTLARSKTILSGPASKCPKTDPCNKCVK